MKKLILPAAVFVALASSGAIADNGKNKGEGNSNAGGSKGCNNPYLPSFADLRNALQGAIAPTGGPGNGGFDLNMWATVVDRDGIVCAVAKSGADRGDQWPGSRVISGQKASTANSFSLNGLALSTANLWAATQPGGSLFGLQFSNPVDTEVAYAGPGDSNLNSVRRYGTRRDPMVGNIVGGVNVFGGGLALYGPDGKVIGAVGVSGDTSCADHNIGWRVRDALALDNGPNNDNIIFDLDGDGVSASGFGHPTCGGPGDVDGNGDPDDVEDNEAVLADAPLG
ncbi:MAG: heme-binding protein [Gammaproteobacteria bacterium]|nr:heme-binding protein [Gammaproteobacteria bacterium]NNM01710.1 heme-binding protein [Gammaproteobacteria bacterium]